MLSIASKIPTVAVGGRGLDLDLPHVDVLANDNERGAALVVEHLTGLGHTRIAHISGLPSLAGQLRMQGYEDAMRAAGLGGRRAIDHGDMSEEGGYRSTVALLSRPDRPDRHLRGQRSDLRRGPVGGDRAGRPGARGAVAGGLRQLAVRPAARPVADQRGRHRRT